MSGGSLLIVGTGIRTVGQLTTETVAHIRQADRFLYLVHAESAEQVLRQLHPRAESLQSCYEAGLTRREIHGRMVARTLDYVRQGLATCLAFYGHPGMLVYPAHEALRRAREAGYPARMLPAVSATDCLLADLELDPADHGLQAFEATEFLLHGRTPDPTSLTILWQVGVVGDVLYRPGAPQAPALDLLLERLTSTLPADHEVILYEASTSLLGSPRILRRRIDQLDHDLLTPLTTLCIPPVRSATANPELARRFGWTLAD